MGFFSVVNKLSGFLVNYIVHFLAFWLLSFTRVCFFLGTNYVTVWGKSFSLGLESPTTSWINKTLASRISKLAILEHYIFLFPTCECHLNMSSFLSTMLSLNKAFVPFRCVCWTFIALREMKISCGWIRLNGFKWGLLDCG